MSCFSTQPTRSTPRRVATALSSRTERVARSRAGAAVGGWGDGRGAAGGGRCPGGIGRPRADATASRNVLEAVRHFDGGGGTGVSIAALGRTPRPSSLRARASYANRRAEPRCSLEQARSCIVTRSAANRRPQTRQAMRPSPVAWGASFWTMSRRSRQPVSATPRRSAVALSSRTDMAERSRVASPRGAGGGGGGGRGRGRCCRWGRCLHVAR